jgi:hypothetical protein
MDLSYALKQLEHEIRQLEQSLDDKKAQAESLRTALGFTPKKEAFPAPQKGDGINPKEKKP